MNEKYFKIRIQIIYLVFIKLVILFYLSGFINILLLGYFEKVLHSPWFGLMAYQPISIHINSSISKNSVHSLNVKKHFHFKLFSLINKVKWFQVLLCITNNSIIQFSISTQFSSIWPVNRTLSGATPPGQSGPWSNSNKGILLIPQSSSITGVLLSAILTSHPGHSLGGGLTPLQKCSWCILPPQPTGPKKAPALL